jgi:glycosyltransferase involved in cell wall biosynthesis
LLLVEQTLGKKEYRELFEGAICLQPYNRADFADRASGVTLDALIAGCPIIATSGTWMGLAVERFEAGKTVEDLSPERLFAAVSDVIADYARYRRNAMEAGRVLLEENSARHLFAVVTA